MTTSENAESGFLTEVSSDIAADNKPAALLELASLINVDPEYYDLKNIADEIASRPNISLYQTLYRLRLPDLCRNRVIHRID